MAFIMNFKIEKLALTIHRPFCGNKNKPNMKYKQIITFIPPKNVVNYAKQNE